MNLRSLLTRNGKHTGRMRISRKTAIPLFIILILTTILIGTAVAPHIPYWTSGDPGKHAKIVPENALAHVQINLKKAADLPVPPNAMARIQDYIGLGSKNSPEQWAGTHASITVLPNGAYAIIIDVRNRDTASQNLFKFLSEPTGQVRELWTDKLVITSNHEIAREIRDRTVNPRLTTLSETELYRQATVRRKQRNTGTAFYFLRSQVVPEDMRNSAALLSGCNPDAWLYGHVDTDRHGNMTTTAVCPRLRDGEPDRPLIHAPPYAPPHQRTDIFLQATFEPSVQNVNEQITKIGIPGVPTILTALEQALSDVAIDQTENQPYSDPLDTMTTTPQPTGILNELTGILDGTMSAIYSGTSENTEPVFAVQLGHINEARVKELMTQTAADFSEKETPISLDPIPDTDLWNVSIATPDDEQSIATISVSESTIIIRPPEAQKGQKSEPAIPARVEIQPHHFMLYMGPTTDTKTITDWWEPGYWIIYTNTRSELEIEHTLTIGQTEHQ